MKRFIAAVLSILLALETVPAMAAPFAPAAAPLDLGIPARLGAITENYVPAGTSTKRPNLILIQDLHANRSVQLAISGILKALKTQRLLPARIATEGASGPVNLAEMQRTPDAKIRRLASDYLVSQGEMPGDMHFVVTEGEGQLYGVETDDVYRANVETFRRSYESRVRLLAELDKISDALPTLKRKPAFRAKAEVLEQDIAAIRQLLAIQVTPEEMKQTLSRMVGSLQRVQEVLPQDIAATLVDSLSAGANFYALALMRNDDLFAHAMELRQADHQMTTVLITGGFHTEAIAEKAKEKGLSYVVVTPAVRRHDKVDENLYVTRLLGQHLTESDILPAGLATQLKAAVQLPSSIWNAAVARVSQRSFTFSLKRSAAIVTLAAVSLISIACKTATVEKASPGSAAPAQGREIVALTSNWNRWTDVETHRWSSYSRELDANEKEALGKATGRVVIEVQAMGEVGKNIKIQFRQEGVPPNDMTGTIPTPITFKEEKAARTYDASDYGVDLKTLGAVVLHTGPEVNGQSLGNGDAMVTLAGVKVRFVEVSGGRAAAPGSSWKQDFTAARSAFSEISDGYGPVVKGAVFAMSAAFALLLMSLFWNRWRRIGPTRRVAFLMLTLSIAQWLFTRPLVAQAPFSRQVPRSAQTRGAEWQSLVQRLERGLPRAQARQAIQKLSGGLDLATDARTGLVASHRGDSHLATWGFYYDNVVVASARLLLGQTAQAEKALAFYRGVPGAQKRVFLAENGQRPYQGVATGHDVTIPDGRMIEAQVMTGPEGFRIGSEIHAYEATGNAVHLRTALQEYRNLIALQNRTQGSPNYGGVRMGPLGNPSDARDQKPGNDPNAIPWYYQYNKEHNNGFRHWGRLLRTTLQNADSTRYAGDIRDIDQALALNQQWRRRVYDPSRHLFSLGSSDRSYRDELLGVNVQAGVRIPVSPLDATSWDDADIDFMETLEPNAIQKISDALDANFRVTVPFRRLDGKTVTLTLYGFMTHADRKQALNWTGEGERESRKLGAGRPEVGTFEWTYGVANWHLSYATEFFLRGRMAEAERHLDKYISIVKGLEPAFAETRPGAWEVPYATLFNSPAWTWLLPHAGPSVIGNGWGIFAYASADVFAPSFGPFSIQVPVSPIQQFLQSAGTALNAAQAREDGIVRTNSQQYIDPMWKALERGRAGDRRGYQDVLRLGGLMFREHPDWIEAGRTQNAQRLRSMGAQNLPPEQVGQAVDTWWQKQNRQSIFDAWALNDTAALLFMRIEAHEKTGDHGSAVENAVTLLRNYSTGLVADPRGWFWSPAKSLAIEMPQVAQQAASQIRRGVSEPAPAKAVPAAPAPSAVEAPKAAPVKPAPVVGGRELTGRQSVWPPSGAGDPFASILETPPFTIQQGEEIVLSDLRYRDGTPVKAGDRATLRLLAPGTSPSARSAEGNAQIVTVRPDGTIVMPGLIFGRGPFGFVELHTGRVWRGTIGTPGLQFGRVTIRRSSGRADARPAEVQSPSGKLIAVAKYTVRTVALFAFLWIATLLQVTPMSAQTLQGVAMGAPQAAAQMAEAPKTVVVSQGAVWDIGGPERAVYWDLPEKKAKKSFTYVDVTVNGPVGAKVVFQFLPDRSSAGQTVGLIRQPVTLEEGDNTFRIPASLIGPNQIDQVNAQTGQRPFGVINLNKEKAMVTPGEVTFVLLPPARHAAFNQKQIVRVTAETPTPAPQAAAAPAPAPSGDWESLGPVSTDRYDQAPAYSTWINMHKDWRKVTRIRIRINPERAARQAGVRFRIRLLPAGQDPNQPVGLREKVVEVPKDGIIDLPFNRSEFGLSERDLADIEQTAILSGDDTFGTELPQPAGRSFEDKKVDIEGADAIGAKDVAQGPGPETAPATPAVRASNGSSVASKAGLLALLLAALSQLSPAQPLTPAVISSSASGTQSLVLLALLGVALLALGIHTLRLRLVQTPADRKAGWIFSLLGGLMLGVSSVALLLDSPLTRETPAVMKHEYSQYDVTDLLKDGVLLDLRQVDHLRVFAPNQEGKIWTAQIVLASGNTIPVGGGNVSNTSVFDVSIADKGFRDELLNGVRLYITVDGQPKFQRATTFGDVSPYIEKRVVATGYSETTARSGRVNGPFSFRGTSLLRAEFDVKGRPATIPVTVSLDGKESANQHSPASFRDNLVIENGKLVIDLESFAVVFDRVQSIEFLFDGKPVRLTKLTTDPAPYKGKPAMVTPAASTAFAFTKTGTPSVLWPVSPSASDAIWASGVLHVAIAPEKDKEIRFLNVKLDRALAAVWNLTLTRGHPAEGEEWRFAVLNEAGKVSEQTGHRWSTLPVSFTESDGVIHLTIALPTVLAEQRPRISGISVEASESASEESWVRGQNAVPVTVQVQAADRKLETPAAGAGDRLVASSEPSQQTKGSAAGSRSRWARLLLTLLAGSAVAGATPLDGSAVVVVHQALLQLAPSTAAHTLAGLAIAALLGWAGVMMGRPSSRREVVSGLAAIFSRPNAERAADWAGNVKAVFATPRYLSELGLSPATQARLDTQKSRLSFLIAA